MMAEKIHPVALDQPPFARHLGLEIVSATAEKVVATMVAGPALINRNGVLHGGALMGLADNIGGTLAFLHLGPGEGTTTMESKTNFFRAVPPGDVVRAEAVPLHLGRKTIVVQTTLYRGDGKMAAQVVQTQFTLRAGD